MFDVHSHILPDFDDGSGSVEESLRMLRSSAKQNVKYIAATPHYYPEQEYPEDFLARRRQAEKVLADAVRYTGEENYPKLLVGAEVAFFNGISRSDIVKQLCYKGTDLILIEMPCREWSEKVVNELLSIHYMLELRPIIAHIERYMAYQQRGVIRKLVDAGIYIQANAGFFYDKSTSTKALKMLKKGQIHLLGSDCHNMTVRKPNMGKAAQVIEQKFGQQMLDDMYKFACDLFDV